MNQAYVCTDPEAADRLAMKLGKTTARGVYFRRNKWHAQVRLNRKIVFYQTFQNYENAVTAAAEARARFGFLSNTPEEAPNA